VHVTGAGCRAAARIMPGVRDLVQMIGDGRTGRVLSGVVCGLHRTRGDDERGFPG
jgi:hypothetical protein